MLVDACHKAVADGAVACVVLDAATGSPVATGGRAGIELGAFFQTFAGQRPVSNPFTQEGACVPERTGALQVAGPDRAVYATWTTRRALLVVLVAPPEMSVALGWALLRHVAQAAEATR